VLTWVQAMLSRRFVVMRLTRFGWTPDGSAGRAVFADVPAGIIDDGIDVSRYGA
jgi:hypothetical protein